MQKKFIVTEDMLRKNADGTYTLLAEPERYVPSEFLAIGPMDGRYKSAGERFSPFFSEFALVKNRVKVEVRWLEFQLDHLAESSEILAKVKEKAKTNGGLNLTSIYEMFSTEDFFEVKEIELETNHDVKSVEIWVARQVEKLGYPELKSYVHIGCTSEDITNPAYARMIYDALDIIWMPAAFNLTYTISELAKKYKDTPMLAHTHGQPATPTTLGKEMAVYAYRMKKAIHNVAAVGTRAKFNGATGNYAAISVAFPDEDWPVLMKEFVEKYLYLDFNPMSTQIESHDYIVEIADAISHFNRIMANFCSDMWTYISMEFFNQVVVKKEVGSSTMPNKVNPINFENGEMNFRKSTSDFEFLSEWLMSSRMQRDLRDSTALRNLGTAFAHSYLGMERTMIGIKKVNVNEAVLNQKLDGKWEVLAEAVQTVLRKYGMPDAYNLLKELTRGKNISKEVLHEFMNSEVLAVIPEDERKKLMEIRPEDYIGLASKIVDDNI